MNKKEIIAELTAQGIQHNPAATKTVLEQLLKNPPSAEPEQEPAPEAEVVEPEAPAPEETPDTEEPPAPEQTASEPEAQAGEEPTDEDLIAAKMAAGLKRDQAERVVADQKAHDENLKSQS